MADKKKAFLEGLTLDDEDLLYKTVGRPVTDLSKCLEAANAYSAQQLFQKLTHGQVLAVARTEEQLEPPEEDMPEDGDISKTTQGRLNDVIVSVGTSVDVWQATGPQVVELVHSHLDAEQRRGGNWNIYMSCIEWLYARKENPNLTWLQFKDETNFLDAFESVSKRLEQMHTGEEEQEDLGEEEPVETSPVSPGLEIV